jgi:putative ABC transport system permease protein
VRANGSETSLIVQGVLRPSGIAAAFSGQVALMDVYAAQMLGGRTGLFDRIDVVPELDQDVPALISVLGSKLGGIATVQRSSARSGIAEDLLQMVRRSALMLAGAAALVACLLTYATTAQWVERQKRQLATLRAVGMEARRVRQMIFVEVSALAVVGTALGVAGGIAISPPLLATLSQFLKVAAVEQLTGVSLQASTVWVAIAVGLVASVAGSTLPARRAGSRFTLDSLDLDTGPRGGQGLSSRIGAVALAAFAILSTKGHGVFDGFAMIRVVALLLVGVLAILALAPLLLSYLRMPVRFIERSWPGIGHLATRFFRIRPWTFAVALTAISTLVGALVTVFLLIATIRSGFERWAESRLPGAPIAILPTSLNDPISNDFLSPETLDVIRASPGVAAVNEQYRGHPTVVFRGQTVPLVAMSMDVIATHGHIPSVGRPSTELAKDLLRGDVAVSPGFSRMFGLGLGDTVDLDTQYGARRFAIAGIYEDFGETNGSILLDLATFDACWRRPGASSAIVWLDGPPEPAIAEIRRRVGARQDLYFADTSEIVAANRSLTDVFTSTLHVLGAFISVLGAIGVMILLAGIIAERRRDLAVLRAAGAEPRQVVMVVLVDALALGFLGALCGVALGLACADPASDILRESFGWILEQRWTAPELPFVIAGAFLAALLGALIPARMAYRTSPDDVFGPE